MKKLVVLFLMLFVMGAIFTFDSASAKKSSKSGGISEEEMTQMSTMVDNLTKKMYAKGLFSPEDNENLISIKIKLDNQMLVASNPSLAPLYYKVGILFKSREMKEESIECFQTILENFADTAFAPKATAQLSSLGVVIQTPGAPGTQPAGTAPATK